MRCGAVALPVIAVISLGGCKPEENAILAASEVAAYAPLTLSTPGAAYLSLHNRGDVSVELQTFASDCFDRVELHGTAVEAGVASMHSVDSIVIDPKRSLHMRPGGMHLMLMQPARALAPGDACTFTIGYSGDRQLAFPAELLDRAVYRPAEPVK